MLPSTVTHDFDLFIDTLPIILSADTNRLGTLKFSWKSFIKKFSLILYDDTESYDCSVDVKFTMCYPTTKIKSESLKPRFLPKT